MIKKGLWECGERRNKSRVLTGGRRREECYLLR